MPSMIHMQDRLTALNKAALSGAWAPADAVDWRMTPRRPDWLLPGDFAALTGQLLRGETLAADICHRLQDLVKGALRESFRIQEEEERRHIDLLNRYIEKLNCAAQPSRMTEVFSKTLGWQGDAAALVLINNVVLEAEALTLYRAIETALGCPLFRGIAMRISKDEARHVRLGQMILDTILENMPLDERIGIFVWIRDQWRKTALAALDEYSAALRAVCGIEDRAFLQARWATHQASFSRCGFLPASIMAGL